MIRITLLTLYKIGKMIFDNVPILRPVLYKGQMYFRPKFSGAGMTTVHNAPHTSDTDVIFRRALEDADKIFPKDANPYCLDERSLWESLWKFWMVCYAIKLAFSFTKTELHNLVECGVGNGYSAFFALRQAAVLSKNHQMHLYDAFGMIRNELTLPTEHTLWGHYGTLDINLTKKNLSEFDNIMYHHGYIPETFDSSAPDKIIYLHIDLNSAIPTKEALNFFLPRIEDGGVILFDDYGLNDYPEARQIIDDCLKDKKGVLLKLPTGQALYHHIL